MKSCPRHGCASPLPLRARAGEGARTSREHRPSSGSRSAIAPARATFSRKGRRKRACFAHIAHQEFDFQTAQFFGQAPSSRGYMRRPVAVSFPAFAGPLPFPSDKARGMERRKALHLNHAFRRRVLGEGRAPAGAPSRHFHGAGLRVQRRAGFPGSGIGAGPVQRAPRRAAVVPPDTMPGAAPVRVYETRPEEPHPIPLK